MPKLLKIKEFFQFQIKIYKKMMERSDFHKYSVFNLDSAVKSQQLNN